METETTLAQEIRTKEGKEKYDAACKRLLSQKIILAWILKSCVAEYRDCSVNDIAEKYIEGTPQVSTVPVNPDETNPVIQGVRTEDSLLTEGTILYDIRFVAYVPGGKHPVQLIINVEAQSSHTGYPLVMRAIYYCCRMISAQNGPDFTNSHYEKIKKVYSIFISTTPRKKEKNTINRYRITVIIFIVFLVVLQQLEGNLIYPKVVGSSIGLPGIWVLAAVTVGGGVMGIGGMLLGVPTAAALYRLLQNDVRKHPA